MYICVLRLGSQKINKILVDSIPKDNRNGFDNSIHNVRVYEKIEIS